MGVRRTLIAAGAVLALAGCSRAGVDLVSESAASTSLTGTEWRFDSYSTSDGAKAVKIPSTDPGTDYVLRLDGTGHYSAEVCNHEWGYARVAGTHLRLNQVGQTLIGCSGEVIDVFARATHHQLLDWRVDGDTLQLKTPDSVTLVFKKRSSIYPHSNARTALAGEYRGFQYRLALDEEDRGLPRKDQIFWWEYRSGPARTWTFFSEVAPDTEAKHMFAMTLRHVPGLTVLAGFTPRGSTTVEYRSDAGALPIVIRTKPVGPTTHWRYFATVVTTTSPSSTVSAYDKHHRELSSCSVDGANDVYQGYDCRMSATSHAG